MEHEKSDTLDVRLKFKTLKGSAVLVYTEIQSSGKAEIGYMQVECHLGEIIGTIQNMLWYSQRKRISETLILGYNTNFFYGLTSENAFSPDGKK